MRKFLLCLSLAFSALLFVQKVSAQVDVTATGGTLSASYTTLKLAFDAINAGTHTGTITIGISGNTAEPASAVLNASGSGSASYATISIQPTGGASRTITGAIAAGNPLIDFNGADNVTIDGLNSGGNALTISNTTVSATANTSTIRFILDATSNTITNCTILGATTATSATIAGTILFSTGPTTGNDNNTISNNNIGDAGATPSTAICSSGQSATITNDNVAITGNNIYNWYLTTGANAINILANSSGWTINNNKFYQTASRTGLTSANYLKCVYIVTATGSGYTINNNIIGYSASSGTGMFTNSGGRFTGIDINVAASPVTNIQGNTLTNISWTTASGASTAGASPFNGIIVNAGGVNVGTSSGNTIGAATGTGSSSNGIYVVSTSSGTGVFGIYLTSSTACTVQNNIIGAIATSGTAAIGFSIYGIYIAGTGSHTVTNNTVGNSTANNIAAGIIATTTALTNAYGIWVTATGTAETIGANGAANIIQNITSNGANASSSVGGVGNTGACGTMYIQYNTISGLNLVGTASTNGMLFPIYSSGAITVGLNILNNTISSSTCSAATSGATVSYIYTYGATSTSTVTISNNTLNTFNYTGATGGSGATFNGIYQTGTPLSEIISNNNFNNISLKSTGTIYLIYNAYTAPANGTKTVQNNYITTGFNRTATGAASFYCYYDLASSPSTVSHTITGNNFSNITANTTGSNSFYGIYSADYSSSNPSLIVSNNTFSTISFNGNSTISGLYLNGFGGTAGTPNSVNGNTFSGITSTGTATIYGLYIGSTCLYVNAFNNAIQNFTLSGASTFYGVYGAGTNNVNNFYNNSVTGIANSAAGTIYGAYIAGGTTMNYYQNYFNTLSSAGAVTGILVSSGTLVNIYQHQLSGANNYSIYGLSSSSTTLAATGINVNGGTTVNVYRNNIYNISNSSAGSTILVNGILLSAGTAVNAYNNLIGNLTASSSTSTDAIRGISITSSTAATSYNVYFNTVNLTGSGGLNFGTSGIYHSASTTATTAKLDLRDNIVVNNCVPSGTGLVVVYRRSNGIASMLNNYAGTSNNNLFYTTPSTAGYYFYHDGTSNAQTMVAYKAGVFTAGSIAPRDVVSVSENPSFLSMTGSNATFLHIDPAIATQIESGAASVSGITDDFDGDTRNVTTPDIGADEGTFTLADFTGPSITYTPLGNTSCTADRSFNPVSIVDASSVNITTGTRPRLYFKKFGDPNVFNDNTNATPGWKYVEATGASGSPFSFTTNFSLLNSSPVVSLDVIQYFVVAQDLAGIPNVSINSGTFTGTPTDVNLAGNFPIGGTINSYTIIAAGLSGTKTIGVSGDYTSLTGASGLFADINTKGLSGALTVNIIDASVTESGANALNAINYNGCASGPYALTIKPSTTATLTGSVASGALIKLNGASSVVIDGSNSGGADRSLTITNSNTSAPTAVSMVSLGTGLGATNNTVKNCNISTGVATSLGYGIAVGGSTPGAGGADNDNVTIQNNAITFASIGIYAVGNASVSTAGMDNLQITGNSITSTSGALQNYGIQVGNGLSSSISGNTITVETTGGSQPVGISLETGFVSSTVIRNYITKVNTTATGGYGGRGITVGTGTATSNLTIANNVIYGVNGSNWSGFSNSSSFGIGIGVLGGGSLTTVTGGVNLNFNSISMSGSMGTASTTAITTALYIGSSASALSIRDNVFTNTQVATSTTQKNYAIYSAAANTAFTSINYNDYYVSNSFNAGSALVGFLTSDRALLTNWQTASGQDANSISGDPMFNTSTNLQPQLGSPVINAGTPIAGITTDILGTTRNASTPTLGAYETASDAAAPLITCTILPGTCATGDRNLTATITDGSGVPTTGALQPRIYYKNGSGGTWYSSQGVLSSGTGTNGSWLFTIVAADMGGVTVGNTIYYYLIAQDVAAPSNIGSNPAAGLVASDVNTVTTPPTAPNTYNINNTLAAGTYTVGSGGSYATLTAAVAAYNTSCLTGPIVFSLTDASYGGSETFPITINANGDASATNTLTIKPASGVSSVITGNTATSVFSLNGTDYVIFDGSNQAGGSTKNLTINNTYTGGTFNFAIGLYNNGIKGATNTIIKNCIIRGTPTVTSSYGLFLNAGGGSFHNTSIINNTIKNAKVGIQFVGVLGSISNNGIISGNIIGDATEPLLQGGIIGGYIDNLIITGNEIFGQAAGNSNYYQYGISLGTGSTNSKIRKNNIHDFYYTGTTGYGCYGIYYGGDATSETEISNNVIYAIKGDGDVVSGGSTNFAYIPSGISIYSGGNVKIYFNSINLTGNVLGTTYTGNSSCIMVNSSITLLDIRNNNLKNSMSTVLGTGTNKTFGLVSYSANTAFLSIDYNNYFIDGINPKIGYLGSDQTTLAAWKTATGKDANSISGDPKFVSATDLHINSAVATPVSNAGVAIGTVTTDYDGDTRLDPPDIGADEFNGFNAVVWTGAVSTNWKTAGNWSTSLIPNASVNATIPSGPTNMPVVNEDPATPAKCRDLTINTGSVTIAAGKALTVSGTLTNNMGSTGLVIKSDATGTGSLLDNGTVTGTATVERYLTTDSWHYISAPIADGLSGIFTNDYLKTSDPTDASGWGAYIVGTASALEVMRGYAVWKPASNAGLETFTGTLNTGTETFTGSRADADAFAGWHLAGNPYPSAINLATGISWDQFEPTAYFWNQAGTNPAYPDGGNYDVYPTYGAFGTHSQFAPQEQGFFVHIVNTYNGSSTLTLSNAARLHSGTAFLKDAPSVTNGMMITVNSGVNHYSDKITVHFNPNATSDYDPGFDAYKLQGLQEAPQLYTKIGENSVTCNSLPFASKTMVIPMGFSSGVSGQYTLKADSLQTFAGNITISLEDVKLGTTQDLRLYPSYAFTYDTQDNANRFVLHFYNPTFGIEENSTGKTVQIYSFEDHLYIKSLDGKLLKGTVSVYDLLGKDHFNHPLANSVLNRFTPGLTEGYYLVRVLTEDGTFNGKVFLK